MYVNAALFLLVRRQKSVLPDDGLCGRGGQPGKESVGGRAEVEVAGFAVFDGFAQKASGPAAAGDGVALPGSGEVGKGGAEAARAENMDGHGSSKVS